MNSSPPSALERLAGSLARGLRRELFLTPKPGLVDLFDSGSHPDLSLTAMALSIDLLEGYFLEVAEALEGGADLTEMGRLGRRAERAMQQRFGTNTHKGTIFLGGLLLVARKRAGTDRLREMRRAVSLAAGEFFAGKDLARTNGGRARKRFGAGGILGETLAGLPSLFEVALPAYREGLLLPHGGHHQASLLMMARLMRRVEDTTALHRCGPGGLARLGRDGGHLERQVLTGIDPLPLLLRLNGEYCRLNLTMGGVADLIGLAFAWLEYSDTSGVHHFSRECALPELLASALGGHPAAVVACRQKSPLRWRDIR